MVHYTGVGRDSSEEDKEDQEEWIEEAVSFQDMLEQARAQSDIYSAEEDSEDEDFEPYVIHYKDYRIGHEASGHNSMATAEI